MVAQDDRHQDLHQSQLICCGHRGHCEAASLFCAVPAEPPCGGGGCNSSGVNCPSLFSSKVASAAGALAISCASITYRDLHPEPSLQSREAAMTLIRPDLVARSASGAVLGQNRDRHGLHRSHHRD